MNGHPTIPPEAPCLRQTQRSGLRRKCPERLRVIGWQQIRFVPLIIPLRASFPGNDLFRRHVGATILKASNKHRLFQQ